MKARLCEHVLVSTVAFEASATIRVWLWLLLKSEQNGHVWIHRRVLPRLIAVSDEECEEAIRRLSAIGYHDDSQPILRLEGDHDFFIKAWRCSCIPVDRQPINPEHRELVLDAGICAHCGTSESLSVDHVIPISRGGTNDLENLQCLCRPCNSRKGARV